MGLLLGDAEGMALGLLDGVMLGDALGEPVGLREGEELGLPVVGEADGAGEGEVVGDPVVGKAEGAIVGLVVLKGGGAAEITSNARKEGLRTSVQIPSQQKHVLVTLFQLK